MYRTDYTFIYVLIEGITENINSADSLSGQGYPGFLFYKEEYE
jgi:hypothetical protein